LNSGINNQNLNANYDFVSLLIGVNNQYQNEAFSLYEKEFPELVNKSIGFANGTKNKVIVVSIPDYAYTLLPRLWKASSISYEIDNYNAFAKSIATKITLSLLALLTLRERLMDTELVAQDGLHPSESLFIICRANSPCSC
jgi:hypothetical protein